MMSALTANGPAILFYVFAALAVVSALGVVTLRNPMYGALSLLVTFLSVAVLFLLRQAEFVGMVQIFIYGGGIMVLFLFVIMLVNLEQNIREYQFNKQWMVGIIASLALGALLCFVYQRGHDIFPHDFVALPEAQNTQQIGLALYGNYMLPFEIASLLLLVAIVGAVVMAKKRI
jgi:NADH-quinone oxidoreductase subunit J